MATARRTSRPTRDLAAESRRERTPRLNQEPQHELAFERGDERSGRIGDPRSRREVRDEFPPRRVRDAGRTAGETADGDITADDLSPETLLDSERSRTPVFSRGRAPADGSLKITGDALLGDGRGADEAELAQTDPVGGEESAALRRKARRHATDINYVEPYEAEELAAAARERRRRRA